MRPKRVKIARLQKFVADSGDLDQPEQHHAHDGGSDAGGARDTFRQLPGLLHCAFHRRRKRGAYETFECQNQGNGEDDILDGCLRRCPDYCFLSSAGAPTRPFGSFR